MAAYGIVRFFPKLGSIMSKVLVATYMFPPILLAIPYSMVMAKLGLVNTRIGLIIVYLSFSVPYTRILTGEAARAAIATADACTRSRFEDRKVKLSEIIG